MNSKTENVMVMDCNTLANGIMSELKDIDAIEEFMSSKLSSADLFRIDNAILSSLRDTTDFSRDLLKQLENGKFTEVIAEPPKSIDSELTNIQKDVMSDITQPLQTLFDDMFDYVVDVLD